MTCKATRLSSALIVSIAALLGGLGTRSANAAVPGTLTQQGRLFDASGNAITNSVSITFTLYDAASGGTNLWTETHTVTPDEGYFSVQLGDTTALGSVFDGSTRYLGVKVGSDPEMSPRETVSSVPYALRAGYADDAAHAAAADNATHAATADNLTCPDANALTNFGFCIWHEDAGATYSLNYWGAAAACKAKGGRLCSIAEVSAAQAVGAEWCAFSWAADRYDNATAYQTYPMQSTVAGCGEGGINTFTADMGTLYDANCCR